MRVLDTRILQTMETRRHKMLVSRTSMTRFI